MEMYELYPTVPTIGKYKRWDIVTTVETIVALKDAGIRGGKTACSDTVILSDPEIEKNTPIDVIVAMLTIYGIAVTGSEKESTASELRKKDLIAMLNDDHKRILSFLINGRKSMIELVAKYKDWARYDLLYLTFGWAVFYCDLYKAVAAYNGKQEEE